MQAFSQRQGRNEMFCLITHLTYILFIVIWKEGNFYLTTYSIHFIYGHTEKRKFKFNDALSTFYLWTYGKGPFRH